MSNNNMDRFFTELMALSHEKGYLLLDDLEMVLSAFRSMNWIG